MYDFVYVCVNFLAWKRVHDPVIDSITNEVVITKECYS